MGWRSKFCGGPLLGYPYSDGGESGNIFFVGLGHWDNQPGWSFASGVSEDFDGKKKEAADGGLGGEASALQMNAAIGQRGDPVAPPIAPAVAGDAEQGPQDRQVRLAEVNEP